MKRQIILAAQFATSRVASHDILALCPHPASIPPPVRSRQRRADIAPFSALVLHCRFANEMQA